MIREITVHFAALIPSRWRLDLIGDLIDRESSYYALNCGSSLMHALQKENFPSDVMKVSVYAVTSLACMVGVFYGYEK